MRRHRAGNLNVLKLQEPAVSHKAFKSYEPVYVHMDVKYLPQMQGESSRRYLFVAIDRATQWVLVQLKSNKTASAQAFLKALNKACPITITRLLTNNGKSLRTACLPAGSANQAATMSSTSGPGSWA